VSMIIEHAYFRELETSVEIAESDPGENLKCYRVRIDTPNKRNMISCNGKKDAQLKYQSVSHKLASIIRMID